MVVRSRKLRYCWWLSDLRLPDVRTKLGHNRPLPYRRSAMREITPSNHLRHLDFREMQCRFR